LLRSWQAELLNLERQLDEMLEEVIYGPWAIPRRRGWRPPLDLYESPDAYVVEIDLPGTAPEEAQILVSAQSVTIAGTRPARPPQQIVAQRCERQCGPFHRRLELPHAIEPRQARAECHHGTFRIHLPKKPQPEKPAVALAHGLEEQVIQVVVQSSVAGGLHE
jgi:HSP20 family protein